jgi:hypothetical protein
MTSVYSLFQELSTVMEGVEDKANAWDWLVAWTERGVQLDRTIAWSFTLVKNLEEGGDWVRLGQILLQ